jgi:hypothetical protein
MPKKMIKKITAIFFLSLFASFGASAQDNNRINQLEQEIHSIKLRLTKLESVQGIQSDSQKPVASSDGWKSVANWRQLIIGMTPADARKLLGEPQRVDGGTVTYWYYPNRGYISFYEGKLDRWQEPR